MANLPSHASPTFPAQRASSAQPVDEISLGPDHQIPTSLNSRVDELRGSNSASQTNFENARGDVTPAIPASLLSPSFTPPATPGGTLNTEKLLQQALSQPVSHSKPPRLLPQLPDVECIVRARIPTTNGAEMFLHLYRNDLDNKEHLAIVFGNNIRSRSLDQVRPGETEMDRMIRGAYVGKLHPGRVSSWYDERTEAVGEANRGSDGPVLHNAESTRTHPNQAPLVRIHSECYTGETAWSARCDCGEQLDEAARLMSFPMETLNEIASEQSVSVPSNVSGGVIVYLRQEGRGIGLGEKLKAYNLQDLGSDTVEANLLLRHPADARSYGLATAILVDLGLGEDSNPHGIRLLTNNPDKVGAIEGPNREVTVKERVPMVPLAWQTGGKLGIKSSEIEGYLRTKTPFSSPSFPNASDLLSVTQLPPVELLELTQPAINSSTTNSAKIVNGHCDPITRASEAMATRLPPLSDVAPSPALEPSSSSSSLSAPNHPPPTANTIVAHDSEFVKVEDSSPTPYGSMATPAPVSASTPDNGGPATAAAGRKRKLNSTSARGVANLTPDQLAKKRANDRQAQRAIRERTKTHIESLEQRVRELSSQKPFLDLQAALRQNEAIQAENREIRQGLKAIMDIIQPLAGRQHDALNAPPTAAPTPNKPPSSLIPSTSPLMENNVFPTNHQRAVTVDRSYTESIASVETPSSTHSAPTLGSRRDSSTNNYSSLRVAFDYQRHNLAHGLDFGGDERMGFNFLLDPSQQVPKVESFRRSSEAACRPQQNGTPLYTLPPLGTMTEQALPAYMTPVRNVAPTCTLDAILLDFLHNRQREAAKGVPKQKLVGPAYPSVSSLLNPEKSAFSHPLSKVFTDILRTFPDISALPEQVAVLYAMFLLMRWQIYPTPENYDRLPDWLTPRPSQLLTPHPAWIDYLPWPRMRDRVVMNYHEYPFENWFIPFTGTLSVNWPYEATDCLLSTGESDELIINPVFERHFSDLNNWSLGPAFAEAYPALAETARIRPAP